MQNHGEAGLSLPDDGGTHDRQYPSTQDQVEALKRRIEERIANHKKWRQISAIPDFRAQLISELEWVLGEMTRYCEVKEMIGYWLWVWSPGCKVKNGWSFASRQDAEDYFNRYFRDEPVNHEITEG